MSGISKKRLIKILQTLKHEPDYEAAHADADDALLAYIDDQEIAAAYAAIRKHYA